MSVQNVGKQLTPQYTENSQFYIIQVFEFPLKIFNVLSAALLHYYWPIFATAASLTHQQSLKSQHKLYRQETQNFILFSKYNGNSLGKSQQQASHTDKPENSVELYHENTAVSVCRTLGLQLTATRESVSQGIWMSCSSA